MSATTKTFLFIPVSSTEGIGEYMRSLTIATQVQQQWPSAKIYFVLNKAVAHIAACPFEVLTTEQSATKDSKRVDQIIEKIQPDFVLFDAAGRARNFKKAKLIGAKVGFISQHAKKRKRGLKLNRLPYIDQHWVVQPDFAMPRLSLLQKIKLTFIAAKTPKNVGVVFLPPANRTDDNNKLLNKYHLPERFFIFNAGSGGHKKQGKYCVETFYQAAKAFSQQTKMHSVVVLGSHYPQHICSDESVTCIHSLPSKEFIHLLTLAKGRVLSAGGTILQCIALKLPSIAVAISSDQPQRLAACLKHELVLSSALDTSDIVEASQQLLEENISGALIHRMHEQRETNALAIILRDITELLNTA